MESSVAKRDRVALAGYRRAEYTQDEERPADVLQRGFHLADRVIDLVDHASVPSSQIMRKSQRPTPVAPIRMVFRTTKPESASNTSGAALPPRAS